MALIICRFSSLDLRVDLLDRSLIVIVIIIMIILIIVIIVVITIKVVQITTRIIAIVVIMVVIIVILVLMIVIIDWLGATYRTPEIDTSEIVVEFTLQCPMDLQLRVPTG